MPNMVYSKDQHNCLSLLGMLIVNSFFGWGRCGPHQDHLQIFWRALETGLPPGLLLTSMGKVFLKPPSVGIIPASNASWSL